MASKLSLFLAELKRRKVVRVAVVYALVGLGVIEGAQMILPTLQLEAAYDYIVILVLFGFPVALVLAWALEVTPQGIQRTADLTPEQLASHAPAKWRASTWVLAGVSLVAVGTAGYLLLSRKAEVDLAMEEYRVAVLPLDNLTGDLSLDGLGETAAEWITRGLLQTGWVKVVAFNEVLFSSDAVSASGDPISVLSLTWPEETGANVAVQGSFSFVGDSIEYRLRVVDQEGAILDVVEPVTGERRDPREAFGRLQTGVMGAIAGMVRPDHPMAFSASGQSPPNPDAHRAYLDAIRIIGRNSGAALADLQRSLELDPDYLDPLVVETRVLHRLGRWVEQDSVCRAIENRSEELNEYQQLYTRMFCSAHPLDSYNAAKSLARIDPGRNYWAVLFAVSANLPGEAYAVCSSYDLNQNRYWSGWAPAYWMLCSTALHMLRDYEGELGLSRTKQVYGPIIKRAQTRALIGMGKLEAADSTIEEQIAELGPTDSPLVILDNAALEFDAHGQPEKARELWNRLLDWLTSRSQGDLETVDNRRYRAETLLSLGRDSEALGLVGDLVQEDPDSYRDLGWLGVARAKLHDRPGAERASETLLSLEIPFVEGDITARRAGIAAHLGNLDEAVGLMEQAISEGWRQHFWNPYTTQYLKPLRGYEPFERLMEPKG